MQWHQWNLLCAELSLHAGSVIVAEEIIHVHVQKGDMEALLAIYQVSEEYGFSILVNSIPYLLHQ